MRIMQRMMNMSAACLEEARDWARTLVETEAIRTRLTLKEARLSVASRERIAPGTIENLLNGRLKAIAADVWLRLGTAVDRELAREIARLEARREVIRLSGADVASVEARTLDRRIAAAREALGLDPPGWDGNERRGAA